MYISENPDTRTKLLHSAEMGYYLRQSAVLGAIFLFFCLLTFSRDLGAGIIFALLFLPFPVYCLYRILRIFYRPEGYIFCTAALNRPNYHWFLKSYSFTVTLDHPKIGRRARQTQPIFLPYGAFEPLLVNYMNQTVTVAYNPLTDTLVVIG